MVSPQTIAKYMLDGEEVIDGLDRLFDILLWWVAIVDLRGIKKYLDTFKNDKNYKATLGRWSDRSGREWLLMVFQQRIIDVNPESIDSNLYIETDPKEISISFIVRSLTGEPVVKVLELLTLAFGIWACLVCATKSSSVVDFLQQHGEISQRACLGYLQYIAHVKLGEIIEHLPANLNVFAQEHS
jgi:hypothetical protein